MSCAEVRDLNNLKYLSVPQTSTSAGTDTASIAALTSPAPSLVSVNLVSSWQETTDLALVSDAPPQLTLKL